MRGATLSASHMDLEAKHLQVLLAERAYRSRSLVPDSALPAA